MSQADRQIDPQIARKIDPWEKAAECARSIEISLDPHRKAELAVLQHMWIALANERGFLTPEELAHEIERIGRLQVRLAGAHDRIIH
jgi:hypothetical protein